VFKSLSPLGDLCVLARVSSSSGTDCRAEARPTALLPHGLSG
jgi:hypothetical protein